MSFWCATTIRALTGTLLSMLAALVLLAPAPAWSESPGAAPGEAAVVSGAGLENALIELFSLYGFEVMPYEPELAATPGDRRLALRAAPYTTIYGTPGYSDFLLLAPALPGPVRVEAKRQQSSGTMDEKLPYLLESAAAMPEPRVIVVMEGYGWRCGAWDWMQQEAAAITEATADKRVDVMDYLQLRDWLLSRIVAAD